MFVDTHAHLTDLKYINDIEDVVKKSNQVGVKYIITSGFDLDSSKKHLNLQDIMKMFMHLLAFILNMLRH